MLVSYSAGENPLIKYHKHYLAGMKVGLTTIMAGDTFLRTGCGKSFTSLKLGEGIDPDFGIHKVVYSPAEYLKVMDDMEADGRKGQVAVIDEGEVTASSAMWQSLRNRFMGYSLATGRYLQSMSIFVSPTFGWLDKRVRVLANHFGTTSKIMTEGGKTVVHLKYYRLTTDQFGDRVWTKKIRMYNAAEKQVVMFKQFKVGLPSENLIVEYEKKAMAFKRGLRKDLLKILQSADVKNELGQKGRKVDFQALAAKALENPLIRDALVKKGTVTTNLLRNELLDEELSVNQGSQLKSLIEMAWGKKK